MVQLTVENSVHQIIKLTIPDGLDISFSSPPILS